MFTVESAFMLHFSVFIHARPDIQKSSGTAKVIFSRHIHQTPKAMIAPP